MINGLFGNTIDTLGKALDLRSERHTLLSSNIANQETPGYRAVDIKFEEELEKKIGAGADSTPLLNTNIRHIKFGTGIASEPKVYDRATDYEGYDKNSVGVEGEMVRLSENTLMYTITSRMLRSKFNGLMTAIKEGGR